MTKAVVFDFDGVIVESVDVKTQAFAKLFEDESEEVRRKVVAYHLEHGGISRFEKFRYYYRELLHRELSAEKERELGNRFSALVLDEVIRSPLVPGAGEAIESLSQRFPLYIASGTPNDELRLIVERRGLAGRFKGVYGSPESKAEIIARVMAAENAGAEDVVMVGDAMSDYLAAKTVGCRFIGRRKPGEDPFAGLDVMQVTTLEGIDRLVEA